MQCNEWDDENFDTLIYSIRQKNCILMLGPDVETELVNGQPKVLTEILANQLAERIDQGIKEQINTHDLAQVSQNYCAKKGRLDLEAKVSNFYNQRRTLTGTLHQNLAEVDFYLIITTTPGNMTYEALTKTKKAKTPIKDYYNFKGNKPGNVIMGTVDSPLMYYLYGSVDNAKSLLLTENDLLDYLVSLISQKPPLPDNIRSELQDENKSFLFLGFGFRHWYLRILLHVLQGEYKKESLSFALEQFTPESAAEIDRNAFYFMTSGPKIHLFKGELNSFVERLRQKYEESTQEDTRGMGLGPNAPEVFICHASEDKDYAKFLYNKLKESGIKPWLDRENLRGSDNWDKEINKTIKQVDYFVVLQSKALVKKQIGYVNREINEAIDRKKEFRAGITFIIPVKIDDCKYLEELKDIQSFDLTDEKNIKELISKIKRDFEERRT